MLTDFGFAKLVGESSMSISVSGGVVGTPAYIAPEVWDGEATTPQTDLYALACIAYEMLTGEVLFAGDTPSVVMRKHLLDGPEFSTKKAKGIPQEVVVVLRQALARDPGRRLESAGALVTALKTASEALQPVVPPSGEARPTATRDLRRALPWLLGLIGAAVVLALLLVGIPVISQMLKGTATPTITLQATRTALPTATWTPTATVTPVPTDEQVSTPPTATPSPRPSDTPTPSPTATRTPTRTPTSTHTPTATSTRTPTSTKTPQPDYPAPTLLEPSVEASLHGPVTFKWSYARNLAAEEAFQVLIWRQGEPHNGAAEFWTQTRQTIDLDEVPQIQAGGAGEYYWTVAVVQTSTGKRLSPEAVPWRFVYVGSSWPGPTTGPTTNPCSTCDCDTMCARGQCQPCCEECCSGCR